MIPFHGLFLYAFKAMRIVLVHSFIRSLILLSFIFYVLLFLHLFYIFLYIIYDVDDDDDSWNQIKKNIVWTCLNAMMTMMEFYVTNDHG